jgi:hypothetical protein
VADEMLKELQNQLDIIEESRVLSEMWKHFITLPSLKYLKTSESL